MMHDAKPRGRPPVEPGRKKDRTLTFRTRADMRARLDAAAQASGRTATQEVELRVEASFRNDDLRAIIREEIRAALIAFNGSTGVHSYAPVPPHPALYREAVCFPHGAHVHISDHSHGTIGPDGSVSCGGLTVTPVRLDQQSPQQIRGRAPYLPS